MPRFTRTLLLLSTLSLLIVPMGKAEAQVPGEITGSVQAGTVESCTTPPPAVPATQHQRCARGKFTTLVAEIEATRDDADRTATCAGELAGDQFIGFTTRETLAEGRGRISPTTIRIANGRVIHGDSQGLGHCDILISGTFHRVGTVAFGGLTLSVHVDPPGDSRDFRHTYEARFDATAVPVPGTNLTAVEAVVEGRRTDATRGYRNGAFGTSHETGRTAADDADRHGGACVPGMTVVCD